jgi:integrase
MAKVRQRTWTVPGQRTKRRAWGFVAIENGKQVRVFRAEWSKEDAEAELAKRTLKIEEQPKLRAGGMTLAQACERSLANDTRIVKHLKLEFVAETPLAEITAGRISEYKVGRLAAVRRIGEGEDATERRLTAAAVNRPLALLRHLLRLAHDEWEALPAVPTIRLEREPQGRVRWLEPDEEVRLLEACSKSRTKHLAVETGLRRSELLDLTWDRVDLSRGVIRLEITKSGRRREVPMRQAVYEVLVGLKGDREGRVWPAGDIRTSFENAVVEAKLDGLHFHDLRHSFASWFVMRGGSLQALQTILGHQDIKMTLRYAHLAPDHLRSEMTRTERAAQTISEITQAITHEPSASEVVPAP